MSLPRGPEEETPGIHETSMCRHRGARPGTRGGRWVWAPKSLHGEDSTMWQQHRQREARVAEGQGGATSLAGQARQRSCLDETGLSRGASRDRVPAAAEEPEMTDSRWLLLSRSSVIDSHCFPQRVIFPIPTPHGFLCAQLPRSRERRLCWGGKGFHASVPSHLTTGCCLSRLSVCLHH